MNSPKPLYKYLRQKKDGVADLVTKANYLKKLNEELQALLPSPLNNHVQVSSLTGNILHLIASSPAWVTKVRLMNKEILRTISNNTLFFQHVTHISISGQAFFYRSKTKPIKAKRNISSAAKLSLEKSAEGLENEELKRALLRLASRHQPPGDD